MTLKRCSRIPIYIYIYIIQIFSSVGEKAHQKSSLSILAKKIKFKVYIAGGNFLGMLMDNCTEYEYCEQLTVN